jgi:hypothetical protein
MSLDTPYAAVPKSQFKRPEWSTRESKSRLSKKDYPKASCTRTWLLRSAKKGFAHLEPIFKTFVPTISSVSRS